MTTRWGASVVAVAVAAAACACQGNRKTGDGSGSAGGNAGGSASVVISGGGAGSGSELVEEEPAPKPEEPEPVDVGKAVAALGAVPAWQAVVDRTKYLARRGQHGVVFGTVASVVAKAVGSGADAGTSETPVTWLVDDTEGNGALAIRVELGDKAGSVKPGDRVALGGAWALDDERRWIWKVDAVTPLPATGAGSDAKDAPAAPGHAIASGELPQGARTITLAKDGDAAYFMLVGPPPAVDGDGWPVADELGNPVYALLVLPGERASYGAQDLRAPDERWQLKRGATYVVRIKVIHKRAPEHGVERPAIIIAKTAPVKVK